MSDEEFLEYIGFGCVLEETEDESDRLTSVSHKGFSADEIKRLRYLCCQEPDTFEDIELHMSHEAAPDYFVIPVAISDGSPWEPLPPPVGTGCWAIPLEALYQFWLEAIPPEDLAQVRQEWERARSIAARYGITLPEGKLMYITDWE